MSTNPPPKPLSQMSIEEIFARIDKLWVEQYEEQDLDRIAWRQGEIGILQGELFMRGIQRSK